MTQCFCEMCTLPPSGATFSPCRTWRYALWRFWGTRRAPRNLVAFAGLNPSKADELVNDNTVKRCINFAKDWGYHGMVMLNCFGYRATQPRDMYRADDPIGAENDHYLKLWKKRVHRVIGCWGNHGLYRGRDQELRALFGKRLWCFKMTKLDQPIHPLYLPRNAIPVRMG